MTPTKKFNNFKKEWVGKRYDNDGSYGYQCVDLVRLWIKESGFPPITTYGNAIDLWQGGLGDGWERVNNSLFAKPKVGAIIFWRIGTYGHVAVAGQSNFLWVEVIEQNGDLSGVGFGSGLGENAIRFRRDFYQKCVGWYNPKI